MESCLAVENDIERVSKALKSWKTMKSSQIQDAIKRIRLLKSEIEQGLKSEISCINVTQTLEGVKDSVSRVSCDHRELHCIISKIGKSIDRNFVADFDSISRPDLFSDPKKKNELNQVILQHFYRLGRLELSDLFCKEVGISVTQSEKDPFLELNAIYEALVERDLSPALAWASAHRSHLNRKTKYVGSSSIGSPLELKLHSLRFIDILIRGHTIDAIMYAQTHFSIFVSPGGDYDKDIMSLMGALVYSGDKLKTSPYSEYLKDTLWKEVSEIYVKDACALLGMSLESPLSVVINAGTKALPLLLGIKTVMVQRKVSGVWHAKDELPIEIDLGPKCRFHSIFACPILKQQTTESNPPLRLTCGHCISQDALNKLIVGQKVKCPYCPVEQNPNDARRVFF